MRRVSWAGLLLLLGSVSGWPQDSSVVAESSQSDSTAAAIHELQQQVKELRSAVAEMRSESEQYRAENAELRQELHAARSPSAAAVLPSSRDSYQLAPSVNSDPVSPQSAQPK